MRSKMIVFDHAAPMSIDERWALVARRDAVLPMVFIRETAARPTENRDLDFLQRFNHVIANAASVGNRTIRLDPDAFIDAVAEMFRKLPVDVLADCKFSLVGVDDQGIGGDGLRNGRRSRE